MSNEQTGDLIRRLRTEKKMTQKQLADCLHISDKTISKWERNAGMPDITIVPKLAEVLGIELTNLLDGAIKENDFVNGNMKNASYYVCPHCHNLVISTGKGEVSCCGRKLSAEKLQKAKDSEKLMVTIIEDDWYITSDHPMDKDNYISFVGLITSDHLQIIKQYPEWNLALRIPKRGHGILLWYSLLDGLFYQLI